MARTAEQLRSTRTERVPPQNIEAEESVLGSMMLSGDAIAQVVEILKPADFYRPAHAAIYEAMVNLYAHGEPVDAVTTLEELRRRSTVEEAGGALYIHHLVESVPTPASAAHYARIVADHALLRRLIAAASNIIQKAFDVPQDPEGLADEAEGLIYGVSRHSEKDEVVPLSDLVHESMEALERLHERDSAFAGLPTGFSDLDSLLQGLHPSNLIIVAARPGVGKSSFVTNLARNAAVESGVTVAMFSLEMSRSEIGMRLLCGEARVPWDKVRAARVGPEDWGRIVEAAEALDRAPIYIVDAGNVTIVDIRAKARRMKSSAQGLGLIIVDYMQLMSSHQRVENRQQEIAEISRSLKLLAKELELPVIAVSQLNRDPERRQDKRPQLADLRECVTGDTLVCLADGRRKPIQELVGTTPEVLAVSKEGRIVTAKSDLVWQVGQREVFRVRLASGRSIRATARHRLLGASGWARVKDLKVGDRVAIARRIPEPPDSIQWPEDRVALLGQLVGDGSFLVNQPMRYTTSSQDNSDFVAKAARDQFGMTVKQYRGRRTWHQLLLTGNGNRWHPSGVNQWLRDLGIFGQRSHQKRLPDEVFRLNNRQAAILLRHLWATDGAIHVRKAGAIGSPRVYFASNSPGLAADVAALLLRLGIVARMREVPQGLYRPAHTVDISGATDQERFLELVGGFGPRREPAARLARYLATRKPNTNVDTLPIEVFDRVKVVMAARGMSVQEMATARGVAHSGPAHFAFAPSRVLLAEYADILDDEVLRSAATSDVFWDRIVEITPAGMEDVYDLTVPGPSSWLADSVIGHNSGALEQDSDVVMLIHREDIYSDDPAVKGLAEIIVAKHRNGPTDRVPLTFLPHLTQFRNYSRPL